MLGEAPVDGLEDATITTEAKYSFNITKSLRNNICLSLHYNEVNSLLYANGVKIHQFKGKVFQIKSYPSCLGNILTNFAVESIKNQD